jgi:DNA-binding response OmpR family regulator
MAVRLKDGGTAVMAGLDGVSPKADTMTHDESKRPASARRGQALLVEDEPSIREVMRLHLTLAGFEVAEISDGSRALELARTSRFDLIVLDVMLPMVDGMTLCRVLREDSANADVPILMVTAKDSESDKVLGLESGADDYLTKPFGTRELVARAAALVRRHRRGAPPAEATRQLSQHDVALDLDKRRAIVREQTIELTKQEFELLQLLMTHPGIVFSREALRVRVWGGDTYVTERTVDTVISRLRRKIEVDAQDPELILTAWGVGYRFVDAD